MWWWYPILYNLAHIFTINYKYNWFTMLWFLFFFFILVVFWAASVVYGISQARVWIRASAAGLFHRNTRSELHPWPTHSQQCQILNSLSEARDQTCILMDTSWVCYHWAMMGTVYDLFSIYVLVYLRELQFVNIFAFDIMIWLFL